jgi:dTDP-4-amino-4,6-dideoxygalactose transaminase
MVFNSLGSNYDFGYVLKSLFILADENDGKKLVSYLESRYSGRAILLYKGREALKLSLTLLNLPPKSKVGVTGFTCFVVYQAIKETGCVPEYLDIQKNSLNFGVKELAKHRGIRVLLLQNTLGIFCDMKEIKKYCKENSIYLIEDMAHSVGLKYETGEEIGTVGDFVTFSFSQDKSIDAVSGGALVIRNKYFFKNVDPTMFKKINFTKNLKNRLYPLFTFLVRKTYPFGVGKFLHFFLKKTKLLSRPVEDINSMVFHQLPFWNSKIVLHQFAFLELTLNHRKKIASIYERKLNIKRRGILRWPLIVKNREKFIDYMKKNFIFISDIWYDAPIAPKNLLGCTNYSAGECPNSENVTKHIVNLPTHINVTQKDAEFISEVVIKWQGIS